jgi:tetratricopeptide (TPR) repeat protein
MPGTSLPQDGWAAVVARAADIAAVSSRSCRGMGAAVSIGVFEFSIAPGGACAPGVGLDADFARSLTQSFIRALATIPDMVVGALHAQPGMGSTRLEANGFARLLGMDYHVSCAIGCRDDRIEFALVLHDTAAGRDYPVGPCHALLIDLADLKRHVLPEIMSWLLPKLQAIETEKALATPHDKLTARGLCLVALHYIRMLTPKSLDDAEYLLVEAQRLAPKYATAIAWQARIYSLRVGQDWTNDPIETAREGLRLAEIAIQLVPSHGHALATAGHMKSYLFKRYDEAIELFERAVAACPYEPQVWLLSSVTLAYVGRSTEGRQRAEHARFLSPIDQFSYLFLTFAATCYYAEGNYVMAERRAKQSLRENPHYTATLRLLALSLAAQGRLAEAQEFGEALLRKQPDFVANCQRLILFRDPIVRSLCFRHLQAAGVLAPASRSH